MMEQNNPNDSNQLKQKWEQDRRELERVSSTLRKQIENLRDPEANKSKRLLLYRAITGQGLLQNGEYVYKGIDLQRLAKFGIFESNDSAAQFSKDLSSREFDPRVPGLPVFASISESISWLQHKHYLNKPTLAVLDLPIDLLYGEQQQVKFMRNHGMSRPDFKDWQVPFEEILRHIQTENIISGEAYLSGKESPSVPNIIRNYELFLQPSNLHADGTIDFATDFQKVELPI